MEEINPDDLEYTKHSYEITLASIIPPVLVHADCYGDALDVLVDHCEAKGWTGLFLDPKQEAELGKQVIHAGNHGLPLNSAEIYQKRIR